MTTLTDMEIAQTARISGFSGHPSLAVKQRLLAMGLLPGTDVRLIRRAPLGDPLEILVRGVLLAIRGREASFLAVEPCA